MHRDAVGADLQRHQLSDLDTSPGFGERIEQRRLHLPVLDDVSKVRLASLGGIKEQCCVGLRCGAFVPDAHSLVRADPSLFDAIPSSRHAHDALACPGDRDDAGIRGVVPLDTSRSPGLEDSDTYLRRRVVRE